jgi:translocation and assembly module TamB
VGGVPLAEEQPGTLAATWRDERLDLEVDLAGLARITGGGALTAAGRAALELDLASERLDRVVALLAAGRVEGIEGQLAGRIAIAAAPDRPLEASLTIPEIAFRYAGRELQSLEPVRAELVPGGVAIRSVYLGVPGGEDEIFVGGQVLFEDPPRLDLRAQASLAATWLQPLLADLDLDGRIDFLGVLRGTTARPELNGQAELTQARYIPPTIPHTVDRARALVLFYPRAVVLDHLSAEFAGGDLRAKGRLELPEADRPLSYRFEGTLRRVAVRWPAGWLLGGDGDLVLTSTPEGRQVRGELRLDRLYYLQDVALSPAQLVQRILSRSRVEVAETDDLLSTTYLAVAISAPRALRVRNNLADLSGGGDLTLRGTLARPVIFGEVEIDPGGTVTYAGNSYELERARLTFANPARIEPFLDVVARSRIDQYDVTVRLGGTLERLETGFSSDPPLPDLDVLALISTGAPLESPTSTRAPADATASATAAESILYGQAASLLTARVNRLFGLDKLRVDPLTSGDAISSARVTVGKRISRELYVTYSIDPSSTAQQILQVEWRLTDRLVLVFTQNGNESYAVDARWEKRF